MAYGYYLEAEYESGFVLREDEDDYSPYDRDKNTFHAILHKRAEDIHGKLTRFSLVGPENTYTIDWTEMPDNARPIYFRRMEMKVNISGGDPETSCLNHNFGYQFNDEDGTNHQEVQEIT